MRLSIARSGLLEALSVVSKGMSARSTLPILSGIHLSALDGALEMQATDLEVSVRHSAPCLVENEGVAVVPGKLLTDIVRSLPEAAVTLEIESELMSVRCQQSSFSVKTLNPADFPKFPEIRSEEAVSLPAAVLASMAKKVAKAVSRDETRAILTGILFIKEGSSLRMVATDSYRLAIAEKMVEGADESNLEIVVPGRALEEASRLAVSTDRVDISASDNQVVFSFGETVFVTRKIEGTFPNYKQLIPKETETTVTVPTEELAAAVKRVSLLAMHNTPLKLSVHVEDQTLSLAATTQDVGDASEDLMTKVEGKDVEIAFNHAFLLDGIASIQEETVDIEVQSSLKPGLLKSRGEEPFTYLLMPVRLG